MAKFRHTYSTQVQPCLLLIAIFVVALLISHQALGQNVPLISGGVGFITTTNGGSATYLPVISPLISVPIGKRVLVESRATILDSIFPKSSGQSGYTSDWFLGLSYLQADFIASRRVTVVGGEFLTPFGTFNERLSPIWINNFADTPLIFPLGTMGSASGVGGMLRGSAFSTERTSFRYAAYFSASSTNQQFTSERSSGGQGSIYFPDVGLELGASYGRLLQGNESNFEGAHLWWEPPQTAFRLRSEYAHGPNSQGYWLEADYRLSRFGGESTIPGRLEPVFRVQQTFRSHPDPSDGLPAASTQRVDFGLDYRLDHEIRLNSSYSRQFSSNGNRNIWQAGIIYRILFPTWREK